MSQPGGRGKRPGTPGPPVCSIRPFKSSEQYLEAMKEDLAEWLRDLYGLDIDAANFLQVLETGLVLCRHANAVTAAALAFLAEAPARAHRIPVPRAGVSCNGAAQPGTFQARDNVSNFIQWCRKEMGIQEVLMFETEDLVLRKNVKNVVLCLLELGRRAWRFGVAAPTLVHLEDEINEELRQELALPPPDPPPPVPPRRRPCHFRNLDQMVQNLVSRCTCPVQFSMVKVSEGKYRVGDSNTLIFIRVLRNHVMVRVGGGWDTLSHYLDKHDPCRCTSLSHKPGSFLRPPVAPVQHEVRVQHEPSQPQLTMTVSRSQSPPPPVDWKTYTSSSRRLRPPAPSPTPRRETAPFLRCQEKPLAPPGRQLSAGDSLPSPQSSPAPRGQDPQGSFLGKREDRYPSEVPKRRTPTPWAHEETDSWGMPSRTPTPQQLRAPEATATGTPARGPSPLPRYSSSATPTSPRQPPRGEAKGASAQLREAASVRSPSPGQGPTKPPARPPTPGRSFPGAAGRGPTADSGRCSTRLRAVTGALAGSRHGDCCAEGRQGDQKLDIWVTAEAGEPRGRERRRAPPTSGRDKEQAISPGLEEELLATMKLLEVGTACPQGPGSGLIPRSRVYVPSLGARWPEPGGPYDKVIQELAQGPPPLIKVDVGAWKAASTGSPRLAVATGPGGPKGKLGARESGPRTRAALSDRGTRVREVPAQGGQDCSVPTLSASLEAPAPSPSDPNSDKAKACPGKGKRTLRKPQRVPSIYKLKLRPRIRPRRDHRPEERPSRIPKPLGYLPLGPARAPPRGRLERAPARGSQGGEVALVDGAWAREEEGGKGKEPVAAVESRAQPSGLGPQPPDGTPLTPEEESWV